MLRAIAAGALTELQPVLDTAIEKAVPLAGAKRGHIRQYDGEFPRPRATRSYPPIVGLFVFVAGDHTVRDVSAQGGSLHPVTPS